MKTWHGLIVVGSVVTVAAAGVVACGGADSSIGDASTDDSSASDGSASDVATDGNSGNDGGTEAGKCPSTPANGNACPFGECFCGAKPAVCFGASIATQCCERPVVCATPDGGGDPDSGLCMFKHPIVDAGMRYCNKGDCYCSMPDSCYSQAVAAGCCQAKSVTCY